MEALVILFKPVTFALVAAGPILIGLFAQNAAEDKSNVALVLAILTTLAGVAGVFIKSRFDERIARLEEQLKHCHTDHARLQKELTSAEGKIERLEQRMDRRRQADPKYAGPERRGPAESPDDPE